MSAIELWHEIVQTKKTSKLSELLAEDVVFYSPVVHTPQRGKGITTLYLSAAAHVFANDTFRYVRETIVDDHAILEFTTVINDIEINGVDMITWNADGKVTEFKVMVRPLKAIQTIHAMMGEMLQKLAPAK